MTKLMPIHTYPAADPRVAVTHNPDGFVEACLNGKFQAAVLPISPEEITLLRQEIAEFRKPRPNSKMKTVCRAHFEESKTLPEIRESDLIGQQALQNKILELMVLFHRITGKPLITTILLQGTPVQAPHRHQHNVMNLALNGIGTCWQNAVEPSTTFHTNEGDLFFFRHDFEHSSPHTEGTGRELILIK